MSWLSRAAPAARRRRPTPRTPRPGGCEGSLEEHATTFGDDRLQFVSAIDRAGPFTPGVDGPDRARADERIDVDDASVVADVAPGAAFGPTQSLHPQSHLAV